MKLEEIASFGAPGRPVMRIVPSPGGQFLALAYGDERTWNSEMFKGAALFRREAGNCVLVGELPVASQQLFVVDDGHCAAVLSEYNQIEMVRYRVTASGLEQESRGDLLRGLDLFKPTLTLLPPGKELQMEVTDRDDGHGWSDPVYTDYCQRIDLATGKLVSEQPPGLHHRYLAPASPCVSTSDGGDWQKLKAIVQALPFRREWPRRVGPKCLLTTSRVIDVQSGETLLGELSDQAGPRRVFHDLSADEQWVAAVSREESFELWSVPKKTCVSLDLSAQGGARCAVFLDRGKIVVGTTSGEAVLLQAHAED